MEYVVKKLCLMRCCAQCVRNGFTLDAPKRKKYPAVVLCAQQFICTRCEDIGDGKEEPVEVLCDEVETVKDFCYLGNKTD